MQSPNKKQQIQGRADVQGWALPLTDVGFVDHKALSHLHAAAIKEARSSWYKANHKHLVENFGDPARRDPGRKQLVGLNEVYWAALWKIENTALYDRKDEEFFRYCAETGLWRIVSEDRIKQEISARILEISRTHYHSEGLGEYRTNGVLNAIVSQLRGLLEAVDPFHDRPKMVHLSNCCITVEDGIRRVCGYSPNHYSRNQSPIPYCPSAKCPRFLDEVVRPMVHPEDVELIQKYMGQCLLGINLTAKILVFDGPGGLGKSQILKIVRGIVGEENCYELRTRYLGSQFETYRYIGKTLLLGADVPANFLRVEGAEELKKLSGGDPLSPEKKKGNEIFNLRGDLNFVIVSNARLKLRLQGDESAWKRRLMIVRCARVAPKRITMNFGDYLLANEGSGILNFALEGLEKLMAELEAGSGFTMTARQQQIVNDLIDESLSLRIFVEQCILPCAGAAITTAEVAEAFSRYCHSRGWGGGLRTGQIIGRDLADLMLEIHQRNDSHDLGPNRSQRGYRGFEIVVPHASSAPAPEKPATDASDAIYSPSEPSRDTSFRKLPAWASEAPDDSEIPF